MSWVLDNLDQTRARAILEELVSQGGGRLAPEKHTKPDEVWAFCPLHADDNASFSYSLGKDAWRCFGCGAKGDLISLLGQVEGIADNKDAFRAFQKRYGQQGGSEGDKPSRSPQGRQKGANTREPDKVIPEEEWARLEPLNEAWSRLLQEQRGWSSQIAQDLDLRLWLSPQGEERVAIPVRDRQGRLLNIRLYRPGASQAKIISFWLGEGSERVSFGKAHLFPPPPAWRPGPIWLCEGEPDCLCALAYGLNACTQTGGAQTWKPGWSNSFAGREVIICYDADQAGREGAQRVAKALGRKAEGVRILAWPDFMADKQDLTDWFVTHGRTVAELEALAQQAPLFVAPDQGEDGGEAEPGAEGPGRFWVLGPSGRASFRPSLLAAEILRENIIISDRESGLTYLWNGRHFQCLKPADLQRLALVKLRNQATMARVQDALGQVVALSTLPQGETLNRHPEFLCLPNGMLHLDTLDILPHDPKYRATYMIPWVFDPHEPEDCLAFKSFLLSTGNPRPVLAEIQEFAGYCLWPDCRYEKALFLVGAKGAGKSTLLDVLQWLVGEENFSAVDLEDLDKPHERAALHEKMLNISDEADSRFFSTKYFNSISSGKSLQAAFKYGHSFTFRPRCKLACSANDFPRAVGHTDAFLDRLLVVRFLRSFRGTVDQDPELGAKLKAELPGIFAWAIVGLIRLRDRGKFPSSQASQEAIREYRRDINNVLEFAQQVLTDDAEDDGAPPEVRKDELYRAYGGWCKDSGYKAMGSAMFFKRLRETGLFAWKEVRRSLNNGRCFYLEGVRLAITKSV